MRRPLVNWLRWALLFLFGLAILLPMSLRSGQLWASKRLLSTQPQAFIQQLAPYAQKQGQAYGVKPSILLAQAGLESDYGRNVLAHRYHNLYGLTSSDGRRAVRLPLAAGKGSATAAFSVYLSPEASLEDYLDRLKTKQLGSDRLYEDLKAAKTYKEAATAFALNRYQQDVDYADKLVAIIEKYQLDKYDR